MVKKISSPLQGKVAMDIVLIRLTAGSSVVIALATAKVDEHAAVIGMNLANTKLIDYIVNSYSRYWTESSLQWRLKWESLFYVQMA